MKKLFLFTFGLLILGTTQTSFASPIEELKSKISSCNLSTVEKQECIIAVDNQDKNHIKKCIDKMQNTLLQDLEKKVSKLKEKISTLQKSGKEVKDLQKTLDASMKQLQALQKKF